MKYIDSEKLIAEIERLGDVLNDPICQCDALGPDWVNGGKRMLKEIRSSIECLQQEQPEVDLEKEIDDVFDNIEGVPRMWHSDEQIEWARDIARHFYELGRLNARKEE